MPIFELKIRRSTKFAMEILISVPPTFLNLRIGLRKRHSGQNIGLAKQRGELAKKILKLKEKHKAAIFSPTEKWCLPSTSKIKLEEKEFVVDAHDKQKGSEFCRVGDC